MQLDYNKETDSLYITLILGGSIESEEVADDMVLDYDNQGHVVGINIQHASQHTDLTGIQLRGFLPELDIKAT